MADVVYSRQLPGGGTVWIETEEEADQLVRGVLAIERRTDPSRRHGHVPPVLARFDGPSPLAVLNALYAIARDNVAVARALRRWQTRDSGASGSGARYDIGPQPGSPPDAPL